MYLKPSLIILLGLLIRFEVGYAQEVPTSDSEQSTTPVEQAESAGDAQNSDNDAEQQAAQDEEAEPLQPEEIAARKRAEERQEAEELSKTKAPRGVFKPTEEISEDSPVPFPVDI